MKILFESKQLNEGPGAGYTVSGTLTNVVVHKIVNVEKVGGIDLAEYRINVEADAEFVDVEANSYYYGGKIDSTPVHISSITLETTEGDISTADVKWALDKAKIKANLGGGWSHSTFDGIIDVDYNGIENSDGLLAVSMEMIDKEDVNYLDRAVQGDEEDDMDESIEKKDGKTLPKDIQKAVTNLLRTSNTLFSEKNLPYATDDELVSIIDDFIKLKQRVMDKNTQEIKESKSLTEDFDEDERIQALAEYLDIDPSEISNIYDNEFETPEGDYLVVDEYEARELAEDDIKNLIDDLGLDSFTPEFKDWIIMNALDNDWFEDAIKESFEYYVEDIEGEGSSMGYDNRLIEEMHDHQVLYDDDFEEDEDGMPNLGELKEGIDIDDKKEEFVDLLVENAGNPVDYCGDNFGWDWVTKMADKYNLLDMDEVVDQAIYVDGIAHFISRYDGEEHELGNGLFAYRTN